MKPREEFVRLILDQLAPLGHIACGRFFGGYGLKSGDAQFAMIFKGALYLRVDAALRAELAERGATPFEYHTPNRDMVIDGYYSVPAEGLDESDLLLDWVARAIAAAHARRKRPRKVRA